MKLRVLVFASAAALLTACASAREKGSDHAADRNELTAEEVASQQHASAYELILKLRPRWLEGRRRQSVAYRTAGQVVVYLDGSFAGGPDFLRRFMASDIESARYLTPIEAESQYGKTHSGGAILLRTRRN